ncbi:MAG: hypothetical protein WCJ35_23070 [Planctomycetota bacterium]
MHAMFVVMMLTVGADREIGVDDQPAHAAVGYPTSLRDVPMPYHYNPPRDPKEDDGLLDGFAKYCLAWWQPMPQTCYTPHFGCYPGNGRDIYRPTAFRGNYYRHAYNYRPLFEYPWQAGMHEPLPLELSSERSMGGNPRGPQPQRAEVIETPSATPPPSMP